ncbi:MAG: hypothetical protein VKK80_06500 [Prochlorothrix sp.]|nr:hypothetical protein [Prochlorothrix sp.]
MISYARSTLTALKTDSVPSMPAKAPLQQNLQKICRQILILPLSLSVLGVGSLAVQAKESRFYLDPEIDGQAVWPCTHSYQYDQACSRRAVANAANEFCVTQGYMGAAEYYVESAEFPWEQITVMGWTERLEESGKIWRGWEDKGERYDRFSMVECRDY